MVPLSAPNTPAASSAPPGMRMTLLTVSQMLSIQGILSAKNSTNSMKPLAAITAGCSRMCRPAGSGIQPA